MELPFQRAFEQEEKKEEMENDSLRNSGNAFIGSNDENHRRSAHNGPAVTHNLASLFDWEKLLCRALGSRPSRQFQLVFKFKMSNMEIGRQEVESVAAAAADNNIGAAAREQAVKKQMRAQATHLW